MFEVGKVYRYKIYPNDMRTFKILYVGEKASFCKCSDGNEYYLPHLDFEIRFGEVKPEPLRKYSKYQAYSVFSQSSMCDTMSAAQSISRDPDRIILKFDYEDYLDKNLTQGYKKKLVAITVMDEG